MGAELNQGLLTADAPPLRVDKPLSDDAEHIVRDAHCPVLVLKQVVVPFAPKNAIAAIDVDDSLRT